MRNEQKGDKKIVSGIIDNLEIYEHIQIEVLKKHKRTLLTGFTYLEEGNEKTNIKSGKPPVHT
jgi:hypothetical protein